MMTLVTFSIQAQQVNYPSLTVFDKGSTELIRDLKDQKDEEIKEQRIPTSSDYASVYDQTTDYLINLVENEKFINDDEIQAYIDEINEKLTIHNPEVKKIKKLLIARDGLQNAISYGEGTVSINLGLIAQAESEDMIAFILAHERAHYHLNHLRKRIDSHLRRASTRSVERRIKKIPEGTMTLEDLEYVQYWFSTMFMKSRGNELEADSLALLMLKNSGYSVHASIEALKKLKSAYHPIYPLKTSLFDAFIFKEIPFKKRWLTPRKALQADDLFRHLLNNDSIETHPDLDLRVQRIIAETMNTAPRTSTPIPSNLKSVSHNNLVDCFYETKFYDLGIHHALQLKAQADNKSYFDFEIGRMLYEIALAKNDKILPGVIRINIDHYPDETKALNYFLYNLTVAEAAEISYLYVKKNFDPQNPDHYRVLHNILLITNRFSEDKELRKKFRKTFSGESLNKYSDAD